MNYWEIIADNLSKAGWTFSGNPALIEMITLTSVIPPDFAE
jgi:hypothetical protein